mmetsp:Transcript_19442/g.40245  ORF Transcript_19442/g.40245 Transcript_19442/m.40245 type:complete len:152 (-) Transcript_19442:255-710(-)
MQLTRTILATSVLSAHAFRITPLIRQSTRLMSSATPPPVPYLAVHVHCYTKPGCGPSFLSASLMNARASSLEAGVLRFDVLRSATDPDRFTLVEVYKDAEEAPKAHKETEHYKVWRETVADMMAKPREAEKFQTFFPANAEGWGYPEGELE